MSKASGRIADHVVTFGATFFCHPMGCQHHHSIWPRMGPEYIYRASRVMEYSLMDTEGINCPA
jgi:hypothetical protein